MDAAIIVTPDVTTLVNILTVEPENQTKLVELLRDNTDNVVSTLDDCDLDKFHQCQRGAESRSTRSGATSPRSRRCQGIQKCGPTSRESLRLPRSTASSVTLPMPVTPDRPSKEIGGMCRHAKIGIKLPKTASGAHRSQSGLHCLGLGFLVLRKPRTSV